jgi:predicted nucleotidyltransferase
MLQKLRKYLKEKSRELDLKNIEDIVLFGSQVKGKEFPADIDLCVIFKNKVDSEFLKELELKIKEVNVHVSSLSIDDFFKKPHSLVKTMIVEGESILTGNKISKNFGFSSYSLFSYNLSGLKASEKVRFVYLMKGRRKNNGVVKQLRGEWITDNCFILPIENEHDILMIFKKWNIEYKKKEALIS